MSFALPQDFESAFSAYLHLRFLEVILLFNLKEWIEWLLNIHFVIFLKPWILKKAFISLLCNSFIIHLHFVLLFGNIGLLEISIWLVLLAI